MLKASAVRSPLPVMSLIPPLSSVGGPGAGGSRGRGLGVGGLGRGQGTFQPPCHTLHYHMVLRPKGTKHNKQTTLPKMSHLISWMSHFLKRRHTDQCFSYPCTATTRMRPGLLATIRTLASLGRLHKQRPQPDAATETEVASDAGAHAQDSDLAA